MMTSTDPESRSTTSIADLGQIVSWLVQRRVRLTSLVFIVLVCHSLLSGARPHDLTNLNDLKSLAGLGFVVAGLALRSWSAGILRKHSELTTSGPYALVRNPLYMGSCMMMIGFCTLIDQRLIWIALVPILVLFVYTVRKEELDLAARFGKSWDDYVRTTPRFIPRRMNESLAAHWDLRQWRGNREYQAVSAALVGLIALKAWQMV